MDCKTTPLQSKELPALINQCKSGFLILFTTFLLFFPSALAAKLTLEDCQRLALLNNEKVCIADLRTAMQRDKVDEVKGTGLPQIKLHGDYIAAGEAKKFLNKQKKANAKASLIVPLFNFGGITNNIIAQELHYESAVFDNIRAKQEVIYAVSQAYFRLLESIKIQEIVSESINKLKEQLRISKDFYEQGLVQKSDILLIEVQMADREEDYIQAKYNISIAVAELNRMIGADLDENTEVDNTFEKDVQTPALSDIIFQAKRCHPALISLETQIKSAHFAYKGQKGALYPNVYVFTNYSTTNDYKFPYTHGIDLGLTVQVNLYDGGITYAKIRYKKKEFQELQYRFQGLEKDIELAIRSAYLDLKRAVSKIAVTKKGIKLAEENMKMAQEQYGEGLISSYDLMSDEEKLTEAKSDYYQSIYDFYKAELELLFTAGILQEKVKICQN